LLPACTVPSMQGATYRTRAHVVECKRFVTLASLPARLEGPSSHFGADRYLAVILRVDLNRGQRDTADVSVVIPFYNGHRFIGRALDSIFRQTLEPKEVVIVDDGSETPFIPPPNPPVPLVVLRHEPNRGIPSTRNRGIAACNTEWIAFLDQDDEWAPDKLERQWRYLRDSGFPRAALFGNMRVAGSTWEMPTPPLARWLASPRGPHELALRLIQDGNFAPWGTMLVHRDVFAAVGLLDETLRGGSDDLEWTLRAALHNRLVWCHPGAEPMLIRHEHQENYSKAQRFFADNARLLDKHLPALEGSLQRAALAAQAYSLGRYHHLQGNSREAATYYMRSLKIGHGSTRVKSLFGLLLASVGVVR